MISERRFDALIAAIYDAATDFRGWPKAMHLLTEAFDAPAALFCNNSPRPEEIFMIAPGVDPAQLERYATHYHHINPIAPLALSLPVGVVKSDDMIFPRRKLERTEIFNDFLLPLDHGSMLGAVTYAGNSRLLNMTVLRRREFDREDIALYERLMPHLRRAVQLNIRLELLNLQREASVEFLHQLRKEAFVVDASAHVLVANAEAERSMRADGGLRVVNGTLRARSTSDTTRLHSLIAGCMDQTDASERSDLLLLGRGRERAPIIVSVLPFRREDTTVLSRRAAAIVFASDPDLTSEPAAERIKLRYALTPAETAFAIEIAKGDGIQACADRLGISRSTARTHLSRIFRKTDTSRQAELARLLSRV